MNKSIRLILIIFILITIQSYAQNNKASNTELSNYKVHIFPDAFLVGTFSDYLGRFYYIDKETQIDRYDPKEKSLAKYVSYYINRYYKIENELEIKESNVLELNVPSLAKRLNTTYYSENGQISIEKLKTEAEKLSFLLGIYYRNGALLKDNIYQIKLISSPKEKEIYTILKELGCEKIVFNSSQDILPQTFTFYFVATPKMIKYFDTIKQEKTQLEFESTNYVDENNKFEDATKKNQKIKKELVKNLEFIFK